MKTIAIISPSSAGHHQTYTRLLTRTVLAFGHQVLVITPDAADLENWMTTQDHTYRSRLRTVELNNAPNHQVPAFLSIWANKFAWVRSVARQIQMTGVHPDLVFHAWLDNCLTPGLSASLTDLVFPYQWSGLYFHPWYLRLKLPYAALRRGPLSNHAALRSSRCPAVAVLDEGIAPVLQEQLRNKPVIVFPDIADDAAPDLAYPPAQAIFQRAQGRTVICLLGALSRRKGLLTMIDMVYRMDVDGFFFVFAGKLDMNSFSAEAQLLIREFVAGKPENCLFLFERIPDEAQFNALVTASDVLFAVYDRFLSSSNLLTKAAIFERPIIVSERYCMGERMARYRIGRAVPENNADACIAAVKEITALVCQHGALPEADYAGYRNIHSISQLEHRFGDLLALS